MKNSLVAAAVGALIVLASSTPAYAGERNGAGGQTPAGENSASLCAYSGLDDLDFEAPVQPGVVQSFGQIVRYAGPLGGANSVLTPFGEEGCNAHLYPNK